MKKIIYLFICILFACQGRQEQNNLTSSPKLDTLAKFNDESTKPTSVPSSVAEIKLAYTATMQHLAKNDLDSITKSYNCNGERSGTVTYYHANARLKLIKHVYAEYSHHEATDTYFVLDSSLYFAHLKRLNWSFESGAAKEGATKDDIIEYRFYLAAGKAIQCLEKKYTIHSTSSAASIVERTPNKTIACNSAPLLKAFENLISFGKGDSNCLEK